MKRKRMIPVSSVAEAMVPLRPMYLFSTIKYARPDPGTPTADVMR